MVPNGIDVAEGNFSNTIRWVPGDGLFYLDWKKRALELISDGFFMVESPIFEDIDGDGHAEIFIVARGYDRTAAQGAALLRWKNNRFQVWWPTWATPSPYVISAQMVKIGRDDRKEIVAVLDPEGESKRRELAVWKLTNDWTLVDKQEIREVQNQNSMMGLPQVSSVTPNAGGADVVLSYRDTVTCRYAQQKIRCPP